MSDADAGSNAGILVTLGTPRAAGAAGNGNGAIAITDHNEVSGALEARRIAEGMDDIKVIVAEEVYAAPDEGHPEEAIACELATALLGRLTGLGMKVRTGRVVCVSKIAVGERRAELHAGGAIAVDMAMASRENKLSSMPGLPWVTPSHMAGTPPATWALAPWRRASSLIRSG